VGRRRHADTYLATRLTEDRKSRGWRQPQTPRRPIVERGFLDLEFLPRMSAGSTIAPLSQFHLRFRGSSERPHVSFSVHPQR
jgi:hypothetical protein